MKYSQAPNVGHSSLGASSAARWFECPGSVRMAEQMPKTEDSIFAKEGTAAHALMETVLNNTPNANWYMGREDKIKGWPSGVKLDKEMVDHVQEFCDWVRELKQSLPDSEIFIEHKFHLKNIHPKLWGTADVVICQPFGELHVIDFKYGAGVEVEVDDNEQLMYYGRGALELGDFTKVVIYVAQPRFVRNNPEKIRSKVYDPKEIVQFGKILRQKAIATEDPKAPLKEGDHCRFCPASPVCPQLHKRALSVAQTDFRDDKLPAVENLGDEQIANIVRYGALVIKWIEGVKDYARARVVAGEKIEGLKLVSGRGERSWNNPEEVERILGGKYGERLYNRKILSVAQAEKAFGANAIEGLFSRIEGNATIAHETDKRKALPSAKDDFGPVKEVVSPDDF